MRGLLRRTGLRSATLACVWSDSSLRNVQVMEGQADIDSGISEEVKLLRHPLLPHHLSAST